MIKLRLLLFVLALTFTICLGCSASEEVDGDLDGDIADGDTTDGDESDGDTADGDPPDGDIEEIPDGDGEGEVEGSGDNCDYVTDCTYEEDCVDNVCIGAKRCMNFTECNADQMCWFELDSESRFGRCRVYCITDMDCRDEDHCIDGLCEAYPEVLTGSPPAKHPEWEGKLHASFSEGPLEFPMTTTMAGYGTRSGPNSPYAHGMGASSGVYDRPTVKVLTMDDGENRVVFVEVPLCFATDFLVTMITQKVIELGGPNLSDSLVVSTGHTHSGPGSYWNLLPNMSFGSLGFGDFSLEIFKRLVSSTAKIILAGQDEEKFRLARYGYALNENFDPEDLINRDRRSENDPFKDNRLMIWRIDDLSGDAPKPWIVSITYATHGTVEGGSDTMLTMDSSGGAANMTKYLYEKNHPGETLNTIFFNGMAGDVAPSGHGLDVDHTQNMMLIGHRVYDKVMELSDAIDAGDNGGNPDIFVSPLTEDLEIKVISKRIPLDRGFIGYADDEFYSDGVTPGELVGGPFRFGAFQCGLLTTPVEENLNIHIYDSDGELVDEATRLKTGDNGEKVTFTAGSDGTYYVMIDGLDGCMSDYKLEVFDVARGLKTGDRCIDAQCGAPCGQCPNFKDMIPSECTEDSYDTGNNSNDTMNEAVALDLNSETESLQVCPYNEDWFSVELNAEQRVTAEVRWSQDDEAYNDKTKLHDGQLGCGLPVEFLNHAPMPQFGKTRYTSILFGGTDMGGGLLLAGLPGESSSRLGHDTIAALEEVTSFENIAIFGYNNDHHFYIDTADDWLQGGYNPSMSIWGFKFGEFCIEKLKDMAVHISEDTPEELEVFANEFPNVKPLIFSTLEDDTRIPEKTALAEIGISSDNEKTYQPADTVRMEQQAKMRWVGADPGVDFPRAYLEKPDGAGGWEPVIREEGIYQIYDDTYYEMRLDYENEKISFPNKPDADPRNYWTLSWEEYYDFPLGSYRFRVEGNYYNGPTDSFDGETGVEAYVFHSEAFDVLPAAFDVQSFVSDGNTMSGSLRYNHPINRNDGVSDFSNAKGIGLLLHSTEVNGYVGKRVLVDEVAEFSVTVQEKAGERGRGVVIEKDDVTFADDTSGTVYWVSSRTEAVEATSSMNAKLTTFSLTLPTLTSGLYTATVAIEDAYGNAGSVDFDFTVPAQ